MKNLIRSVFAVFLLASPVGAGELFFDFATGGISGLRGEVGYGNWLTHDLWEQGRLQPNERLLESFSFFVSGTGPMGVRAVVGVLEPDGSSSYEVFETFLARLDTGSYEIQAVICGAIGSCPPGEPQGLILDPALNYMLYVIPNGEFSNIYPWTIATTPNNYYEGIVGVSPQLWTTNDEVVPINDIAMNVKISEVPEPSILMLMGIGLFPLGAWLKRR